MDKKQAYEIVLKDLMECNLFCGKHYGKNFSFMNGIATVMESIAYSISDKKGTEFEKIFSNNMLESKKKCRENLDRISKEVYNCIR